MKYIAYIIALLVVVAIFAPHECGMCGAHIHDWWLVPSDAGSFVEVCHECYELCQ